MWSVIILCFAFMIYFIHRELPLIICKAFVAIGDFNGHVGLGVKCSKEVATAIRGAIILAKLSIVPVRRGYWGNKIGKPHTVPCKVSEPHGVVSLKYLVGFIRSFSALPLKLGSMTEVVWCYFCQYNKTCSWTYLGTYSKPGFHATQFHVQKLFVWIYPLHTVKFKCQIFISCLLYTSPSPRD